MFGIGVIAATAWCHLLTDAYAQFSNPCLDQSWQGYGANFVGVFALAASFAIQLIELMAVGHAKHRRTASDLDPEPSMPDSLTAKQALPASHGHNIELEGHYHEDGAGLVRVAPLHDVRRMDCDACLDEVDPDPGGRHPVPLPHHRDHPGRHCGIQPFPDPADRRLLPSGAFRLRCRLRNRVAH